MKDPFWVTIGVSMLMLTTVYCIAVLRKDDESANKVIKFVTIFIKPVTNLLSNLRKND